MVQLKRRITGRFMLHVFFGDMEEAVYNTSVYEQILISSTILKTNGCPLRKKCITAKGRDNIFSAISERNIEGSVLVIADGAAFGAQMEKV